MNSSSHLQEIKTKAVSNFRIHLQQLVSTKKNETLAGVDTTYPISCSTPPACKLAPIGAYVDGANDLADPKSQSQLLRYVCGANPQGASNHNQGAEIDLSVVDGKHNRTGRRQARSSVIPIKRESELHTGSNPVHPIPSQFHSCVGNRMNEVNKPRSLYLYDVVTHTAFRFAPCDASFSERKI